MSFDTFVGQISLQLSEFGECALVCQIQRTRAASPGCVPLIRRSSGIGWRVDPGQRAVVAEFVGRPLQPRELVIVDGFGRFVVTTCDMENPE